MGLVELGKHTSLSPAMLSKIENGHVIPTVPTLMRIALAFSVGLDYFFTDQSLKRLAVVRQEERQEFHDMMGGKKTAFRFQSLDFRAVDRKSSAYIAEFEPLPPEAVTRHEHQGSEFIYVMAGKLGLVSADGEVVLHRGDSAYLDPSFSHGYRQVGPERCQAIVVTVP